MMRLVRAMRCAAAALLLVAACTAPVRPSLAPDGMVSVPAGSFRMGVTRAQPDDEGPAHSVVLKTYWIDRHEVTNADYRRCVEVGRCPEPADLRFYGEPRLANHPVVFVSWYAARDYCHWRGARLPSEAEWEKAARGEGGRTYPWGDELLRDRLNADQRLGGTSPVGSFPEGAGPYGAADMAGNVWEWVDDWYEVYPGNTFRSDLFGQKYKVVRGGSWNHPAEDARTFHRDIAHPARTIGVVGFRCVVSL